MNAENKVYKVIWLPKAMKALHKLKNQKLINEIKNKVKNELVLDPWRKGERLEGKYWEGLWKYRIRDYRVIYQIIKDQLIIEIIDVDNRDSIYKIR